MRDNTGKKHFPWAAFHRRMGATPAQGRDGEQGARVLPQPLANIIPTHGSGLLDALTVEHGPSEIILPLLLRANMVMRALGIRVRIRHDFAALVALNERELGKEQAGNWFRLVNMLLPEYGASAENAYWLSGETRDGEIVFTLGGRIYHWPETTLYDEARLMFYGGREVGQRCAITAELTKQITGVVQCAAGMWIRPDFRKLRLTPLISRIGRAYVASRWLLDWSFILCQPDVDARVIAAYGFPPADRSILLPGSPWGDLDLAVTAMTRQQAYDDLAGFLAKTLSLEPSSSSSPSRKRVESVSSTSPEPVLQGSISLS